MATTSAPSLLDLVGNTPLVELPRLAPKPGVRLYAKLEGQNPTGSIKDRVAKAMIEAAEASGDLEPGRELLEPTSGNTGISLALVAKLKDYPLTCVMPENATEERTRLLRLFGAEILYTPGDEGSNGAVRRALELAEAEPRYFMPFQYGNESNPRAHYDGTGAEIAEALDRVDVLVAGLGTGGTLMGAGDRLRERWPDVVVAAAEPLPGDPIMGLRSLEDGYVPPVLDVSRLDRKVLVSNEESVEGLRASGRRGDLRRRLLGRGRPRGAPVGGGAGRGRRRLRARRRRLEVSVRAVLGGRGRRALDGAQRLVVVPAAVRQALEEHARAEAPNEACGLVAFKDGVAERYVPGRNAAASPYRFELEVGPETWFLEDEGYDLAVFHSHLSAPARPSRTDVENIGLWEGRPYLILTLRTGELAAFRIEGGRIADVPLSG
jgi:cysteine synthase/proteasome lid subunit RPN8/RPN11